MYVIILVTLFNFLAAVLSGPTGFGMSTITTPFLVSFFPAQEVFLFTGLTHSIASVWILFFLKKKVQWRLFALFGLPMILGSFLGAWISFDISHDLLMRGMGLFLILYVVLIRWYMDFKFPASDSTALIGGFSSGFLAGIFGFSGAIRSVFLQSFMLSYQEYIVMSHMFELITDSTRSIGYLSHGMRLGPDLYICLLLAPVTLIIGAYIVKYLIKHLPEHYFNKLVTFTLFLEGIRLMVFG
ncbi:hypothetical protein COB28_03615 [Candidatus Dependentiae bacterium]|nr:MAG: hypothetical protein COB28_03615 [Candidatus Dependentiae bacterium]